MIELKKAVVISNLKITVVLLIWMITACYVYFTKSQHTSINSVDRAISAVENQPLSPKAWIKLSKQANSANNNELAESALDIAASLSLNRKYYLRKVYGENINRNRIEKLAPVANRLTQIDSYRLYEIFLLTQQYYGVDGYLQRVLPGANANDLESRNFYFKQLFDGAFRERDAIMIWKIWSQSSDNDKISLIESDLIRSVSLRLRGLEGGYEVIDRIARYHSAHERFTGEKMPVGFIGHQQKLPLCWYFAFHPNAEISFSPESLGIEIYPVSDKKNHMATCYISVNLPGPSSIRLNGDWQNQNSGPLSVAKITIRALGVNRFRKQVQLTRLLTKKGNWGREEFALDFKLDKYSTGVFIDLSFPKPLKNSVKSEFVLDGLNLQCLEGCKIINN